MNRSILSLFLVGAVAACGGDAESREALEDQAIDTTVTAERVEVTPPPAAVTTPAQPPRVAPPRTTPVEPQPVRAIPAGTVLTFEVRENVSTSSHASGDAFNLALVDGVSGPAGAVLPAGTWARGVVTDSRRSSGPDDQAVLGVRVVSVEVGGTQQGITGEVESAAVEGSTRDSAGRTAATIATGTAAGAIIGQVLGRDTRSTVTGAAVGTAVGVGVALVTRGGDAQLPPGSRIVVRLNRDLVY